MTGIEHGGALDRAMAAHGGRGEDWLDLSTGINPVPYPVPDIPGAAWHRLPDDGLMTDCLAAARDYYGVPASADIVAAPGTQAIIQWLPVLFNYLDQVTVVSPTYGEYVRAFHGAGAHVDTPGELPLRGAANPLLIAGQPNNPDGRIWPAERLLPFIHGEDGVRAVIADEAFADVMPERSLVRHSGETGLMVLKSFGKFFGLAGLRLGFAIGDPDIIASLGQMLGPWAVSGPALAVGAQALRDREWITESRARLSRDSARLETILGSAGLEVIGKTDLFVLARHAGAARIAGELARRHVLVRAFDYDATWLRFGLPASDERFLRLESALAEIA
jgi:cobalamin biosynthesis protein CobC